MSDEIVISDFLVTPCPLFLAYPNSNGYYMQSVVPGNYTLCVKTGNKIFRRQNVTILPGKSYDISLKSGIYEDHTSCQNMQPTKQPMGSTGNTLTKENLFTKLFVIITFVYTMY